MARGTVGLGLTGLFVVFFAVLLVVPYVKNLLSPNIDGFSSGTASGKYCKQQSDCSEGQFCTQNTCVDNYPSFNINDVKPNSDY
jgi:hypothetical protein